MKSRLFYGQRSRFLLAFVIFTLVVLTAGCARKSSTGKEIWAKVDGKPIYRDQVERIYRSQMMAGSSPSDSTQKLNSELNILDGLITNQILVEHALRSHIAVSKAEVDKKITKIESPYAKSEFEKKLAEQGLDLSDLRQEVRQSLMISKLINKEISSRLSVSSAEIGAYYESNKTNFTIPETQYHLAQIEVTPTADSQVENIKHDDARTPQEAERKIKAIYAQLQSGGDFAELARDYSEDPKTAAGGGDMGFIPASALKSNPQLKRVVTSLKVGQTSGVIRSKNGYHIIKLLGREKAGQYALSDPRVQNAIRQALMSEKEQLLKTAYIEVLRNRAKVVNYLAEKLAKGELGATASKESKEKSH